MKKLTRELHHKNNFKRKNKEEIWTSWKPEWSIQEKARRREGWKKKRILSIKDDQTDFFTDSDSNSSDSSFSNYMNK